MNLLLGRKYKFKSLQIAKMNDADLADAIGKAHLCFTPYYGHPYENILIQGLLGIKNEKTKKKNLCVSRDSFV